MLKLIKNMRRKEKEMALLCLVFVVVQIYFDLRLPDYMTELTMLIKTSGTTADIAAVGLKMLRLHGGKRGAWRSRAAFSPQKPRRDSALRCAKSSSAM